MAAPVGSLVVRIGADVQDLVRGVGRAESSLQKVGKVALNVGKVIATALAAAGTAVVAFGLKGVKMGDQLAKTAQKLGLTVDALEGLRFAAQQTGVEQNKLDLGIQRMTRRIAEAAQGTGEAKNALRELGVDAQALSRLTVDEQFKQIADAMEGVESQSDRVRLGFKLFDSEGVALINTLKGGSAALDEYGQRAKALGLTMDNTQTRVVQEATDALGELGSAFKGMAIQIGAAVGPAIIHLSGILSSFVGWISTDAIPRLQSLAERFLGVKTAVDDLSDAAATTLIRDLQRDLEALNADIEKTEKRAKGRSGIGSVAAETQLNDLYEDRQKILMRIADLHHEMQTRTGTSDAPAFPSMENTPLAEQDQFAARAEQITASMMTELEKQQAAWQEAKDLFSRGLLDEETMARVRDSLLENIEIDVERMQHREQLEQEHQNRLTAIEKAGLKQREQFEKASLRSKSKTIASELAGITAGVAQHNRKLFELNKLAGIANAIVNAYEGISLTLKSYPYPINIGMAAAHGIAAFAQVNAIRSQSFGGGGAAPSVAGSTPAAPVTPVQAAAPQSQGGKLFVENVDPDSLFSGRMVRQFAERLQEHVRDGGKVVFV